MKTAIQDVLDLVQKRLNEFDGLKGFEVTMMTQELNWFKDILTDNFEKEKEQIQEAHKSGGYEMFTRTSKHYYGQTFEQKQHIIDIMEADENDGLYNQSFQKSDKEIENWHIIESLKEGRTHL